jgi:hypothetical protein
MSICKNEVRLLDNDKYEHFCPICKVKTITDRPELIRKCGVTKISKATKIIKFTIALTKFIAKGYGKFLPENQILNRFEICKQCANFTGSSCKICGCNCGNRKKFLNKLAFPTEECPEKHWLKTI